MKLLSTALVMSAALMISGVAFAEEGDPKEFPQADANGDGFVDKAEFAKSNLGEVDFGEVDEDGDGKLNPEEYKAALESCD